MAQSTVFKTFLNSDVTTTKTLLHEAIPITGSLVSGTYGAANGSEYGAEPHIKKYSHGMFQSVYDYPHLSSSANHIFDISTGVAPYVPVSSSDSSGFQSDYTSSAMLPNAVKTQTTKKKNVYIQMAQLLAGYDINGSVRLFDRDGDYGSDGDKILDPIFLTFSRLLVKDEIKKGSFSLRLGTDQAFATPFTRVTLIKDTGADTSYRVNSPVGEYGILYATDGGTGTAALQTDIDNKVGLIYYQAGVVVLDGSKVFRAQNHPGAADNPILDKDGILAGNSSNLHYANMGVAATHTNVFVSGTIDDLANSVRNRIQDISFNNTTELNSAVYFCRAHHNEFNYSSNPTYLTGSQLRVKKNVNDPPRSYVTTVGMYSTDNELLAVAKLSEPIRKDPTNEVTLRVRLDY